MKQCSRGQLATADKMRVLQLAVFFLVVSTGALGCNQEWISYNGSCYKIEARTFDVRMARKYCQVLKADLAFIDQDAARLIGFDPEKKYWVREDSIRPTDMGSVPPSECPYIFRQQQITCGFLGDPVQIEKKCHSNNDWFPAATHAFLELFKLEKNAMDTCHLSTIDFAATTRRILYPFKLERNVMIRHLFNDWLLQQQMVKEFCRSTNLGCHEGANSSTIGFSTNT
ncbi:hypothetical protein AVEN_198830-1 [Araneus ventricosus]|uniref:C-type lectin domain-containing protein n=1 Tax=Araneus ventricosus TaxID=182803 RepID=A0A4Y2PLZ1_ARAVE|nr:hypothetical protein AVEN_198830-1 [Araneus ventricosus]